MKRDQMSAPLHEPAAAASEQLYQQLGHITRQLHDAMQQLGLMPGLQQAAQGLPDARSRLGYIASKTAEAAERVLNSVDQAKAEQAAVAVQTRTLAAALQADAAGALASGAVARLVSEVDARSRAVDGHLTDIMLAQDFHDLTGQVVAKVVALADELEHNLLRLLLQVAPAAPAASSVLSVSSAPSQKAEAQGLQGPVINAGRNADVVANQREADELLASLGF